MKYSSTNRGYTLLFAVLTATLVLGVTVFILSTSRKQFLLASTARESMYSLYAADSGIECASLDPEKLQVQDHTFECNGVSIQVSYQPEAFYFGDGYVDTEAQQAHFKIGFRDGSQNPTLSGCADITYISYHDQDEKLVTVFQSRGYNLCELTTSGDYTTAVPVLSSSRIVERALELTYR